MSTLISNPQEMQPQQPKENHPTSSPRLVKTLDKNGLNKFHKKNQDKQNLSLTLQPKKNMDSFDLLEKNQNSPYLEPVDGFGNYPPPQPLIKSKTSPSLAQPIYLAKIIPPSTPRTPRKYIHTGHEGLPYSKRAAWQQQSESYFFNQINQKHQQKKQYDKIYSTDYLRQRQLSIKRVTTARQMKEIEERRQRYQECKDHQRSVQEEERRQRFYNDEIYCRTGKQYRYIPNYDRCDPNNDYYIYI